MKFCVVHHTGDTVGLLACPFCGLEPDVDLIDTLYPTGACWIEEKDHGLRHYVRRNDPRLVPPAEWGYVWSLHCKTDYGGCGVEMSGDSVAEVIEKWNTRTTKD